MPPATIESLQRRRTVAMGFAAGACALGVVLQLWLFYGGASSLIDSHLLQNALAFGVLGSITTVLVVILGVWAPTHDRIVQALRTKIRLKHLPTADDSFASGPVWHTTPPPRHHLH